MTFSSCTWPQGRSLLRPQEGLPTACISFHSACCAHHEPFCLACVQAEMYKVQMAAPCTMRSHLIILVWLYPLDSPPWGCQLVNGLTWVLPRLSPVQYRADRPGGRGKSHQFHLKAQPEPSHFPPLHCCHPGHTTPLGTTVTASHQGSLPPSLPFSISFPKAPEASQPMQNKGQCL